MGKLDFIAEKWEKRVSESESWFLQKTSSLLEKEKDPFVADFVRVTALSLDPIATDPYRDCIGDPWWNIRYDFWEEMVSKMVSKKLGKKASKKVSNNPLEFLSILNFVQMEMDFKDCEETGSYLFPFLDIDTNRYFLKHQDLFDISTDEIRSNIGRIVKIHDEMVKLFFAAHKAHRQDPPADGFLKIVDPTLEQGELIAELVILGKLNCLPCYTENFRRGLRECGITDHFCEGSLLELCDFFDSRLDAYYGRNGMNVFNLTSQSVMKFLHTGFSEIGKALRQQETGDPAGTAVEMVSG